MPFNVALSGLNAASLDLRTTGNNIANAGTAGFKESRTEFADQFAALGSLGTTGIGAGVRLAGINQQFSQGTIDFTGNSLDLAINGQGFFVVSDGSQEFYSRAGAFQVNRDGFVVNGDGQRLRSYPAQGAAGTSFTVGTLRDTQLTTAEATPQPTNNITAKLNLDARRGEPEDIREPSEPNGVTGFRPNNPSTYTHSTSVSVFDSLGEARNATIYFRKEVGENEWSVYATVHGLDNDDTDGPAGVPPFKRLPPNGDPFVFETNGLPPDPAVPGGPSPFLVSGVTFDLGGRVEELEIDFDLSQITQFSSAFNVNNIEQNGFAAGVFTGVDISESGVIFARFTNGQTQALGKVAVAKFSNPQGLQTIGSNLWAATRDSGEPVFGEAGSGGLGALQSGGLETSNVDLARQLIKLISAQRAFQANAQVISAADTVTQTVINIR